MSNFNWSELVEATAEKECDNVAVEVLDETVEQPEAMGLPLFSDENCILFDAISR